MLTEDFADLFEGRVDACGTPNGGCLRVPSHEFHLLWEQHLNGAAPIGIYPVRPGNMCRWGVVDFDIKSEAHRSWDYVDEAEAHLASLNLQKVLKYLGVTSWIERTRSCGRHVWLFASTWVPASTMRHALLTACKVAGVSSREINPKQSQLGDGQLGNYVRLPYPSGLRPNSSKQMIIDDVGSMPPQQFVRDALAARTPPQTLEAIAAKWRAPERKTIEWSQYEAVARALDIPLVNIDELLPLLNRAGQSVFVNGPNDGDRSRGLSYLARQARSSGLTPSQALTLLAAAEWQKFRGRHDEEQRLREIVQYAYND